MDVREEREKAIQVMYSIQERIINLNDDVDSYKKDIENIHNKKRIGGEDLKKLECYKSDKEALNKAIETQWDLIDFIAKKFDIKYSKDWVGGGQIYLRILKENKNNSI